ncbi:hypothetical protein RJT34_28244 [Clitoria ternatea]|uniref:F-box domain-containing protein n=1 Tax=Clitoria ternatea TaxID=43366 RepID=A0AAN9F924_CLITE
MLYLRCQMVSNGLPLHTCSGRKRKRNIDDHFNRDREGARLKETQGEKDQMDQSVEKSNKEDNINCDQEGSRLKETQGERDLDQMDQSVEKSNIEDDINCDREGARLKETQGENYFDQMDQSVEESNVEDNVNGYQEGARLKETQGEKDFDQMDQSVEIRNIEDNIKSEREGARLKETQPVKDLNQMDQSFSPRDRISRLPDHIIHNILSHFRNLKDAGRTSILSKRWRALWFSSSVLVFDERTAGIEHEESRKEQMFREHVSTSLHAHLKRKMCIQKLVLHMTSFTLFDTQWVDHWLSAAMGNIKELDLHFGIKNSRRYTLPQTAFSSKTLTGLRLSGCKLEVCDNIMLPELKKLYLRKVPLVESIIQNLISSCHLIEDLRFIKCSGLKHLHVSNLIQLNRVEIHYCYQLKKVEINAPNLHTFWYCGKKTTPCKVSLEGCTSLKRLTLEHPQVTHDFCENQINKFPLLEKLDLCVSDKMKNIILSSPHLQKFSLKGCKRMTLAFIEAPKLLSFECKGEIMPWIHLQPFRLTGTKLSFVPKSEREVVGYGDKIWVRMKTFIENFDPKGFKLVLHSNKNIVIHEDLSCIKFPPSPGLSCEIIKSSAYTDDILFNLLRTLHPVSLSIISPSDSKFPKLMCEMIKKKDEDLICCNNASNNKCWRHFLEDVKIEDLNDVKFEVIEAQEDERTSNWYKWLKEETPSDCCQITNLRLFWNSHQQDKEA